MPNRHALLIGAARASLTLDGESIQTRRTIAERLDDWARTYDARADADATQMCRDAANEVRGWPF